MPRGRIPEDTPDAQRVNPRKRMWSLGALSVITLIIAVGLLISYVLPQPARRKYPDRIPVRFWHQWTAEWAVVVNRICDRFNESQDTYEVIPLSVPPTAADSKFLLAVAGGDPPDVMGQWNNGIPKWAESGLLTPLDDMMSPVEAARFHNEAYPAARGVGMFEGKVYGICSGMGLYACFYRPEYLRQAGLDPDHFPETLEELVAWGEKLTRHDKDGNVTRLGFLPNWWFMYAPGFGEGFYDWQKGRLTLDESGNLKALEFLVRERQKLGFENIVRFEAGLLTGGSGVEWPFISGDYAITVDGQWRVEQLAKFAPNLEYRTAPLPPPVGGHKGYGWPATNFLVIPRDAKHTEGAWEFIKFWSGLENPQGAAEFMTWGGWLPLLPETAQAPVYQEYVRKHPQFKTFLDLAPSKHIQPTAAVPYQIYLWDRIARNEDLALRGKLTPKQALEQLKKDVDLEIVKRERYKYHD